MSGENPSPSPEKGGEQAPPSLPGKGAGGLGLLPHLLIFLIFLALWTWKLLEPVPVPPRVTGGLSAEVKFALAKILHVAGYAFLTVLAVTLPVSRLGRWFLVLLLVAHGAATEFGQTFIPNRTGKFSDALLDWTGVAVGVLLLHWWRRQRV
jgi:VanZ family protein